MSMVIQHNAQAQLALGELNKNVTKVGKLLAKVSSGQKINSAQDDASSYVISEKMREQIRSKRSKRFFTFQNCGRRNQ